jgi:hypothetical protein
MNTARRKPENNETNAARQQRLRERRKAQGFKRVSLWLSPEQVDSLERLGGEPWLGSKVKQLLDLLSAPAKQVALFLVPDPDPEIRNGCAFEPEPAAARIVDSATAAWWRVEDAKQMRAQGLSWGAIARQWNEQGRRTDKGAQYRGPNIAREVKKWEGG